MPVPDVLKHDLFVDKISAKAIIMEILASNGTIKCIITDDRKIFDRSITGRTRNAVLN